MNASVNPRGSVNELFRVLSIAGCLFFAFAVRAEATTFTVTKTADTSDGVCNSDCSLREAIIAANANGSGTDTINFNLPALKVITPTTPLPAITTSLTIDGGTLNSYPNTELNGISAGANADGLVISSPASGAISVVIKNLAIYRFSRYGIFLNSFGGGNFTVLNCAIGTDTAGTVDQGNGSDGIRISAYSNSTYTIGGSNESNVISGNNGDGISIAAANASVVNAQVFLFNNAIGSNEVGNNAIANSGNGVRVNTPNAGVTVTIGGSGLQYPNTISGNSQNGIYASADQVFIYRNSVGLWSGNAGALGNALDGIRLDGTVNATIGGTQTIQQGTVSLGNAIGSNKGDGISILSHNAVVQIKHNQIGNSDSGVFPNLGNGIQIKDASAIATADIQIGSDTDYSDSNTISGNSGYGILIDDKVGGVRIYGNYIGMNPNFTSWPNLGGIRLSSAGNKIGKAGAAPTNYIGFNTQNGILIIGPNATGNEVYKNVIGTNGGGLSDLGNSLAGILINNASGNKIGTGDSSGANLIAFNGSDGVSVVSGTNNSIRGNAIYSNDGLGINLGPSGVTPNDNGDSDSGANDLQNFPVLLRAHSNQILGSLNSTANTHFIVDYYRVDSCNASGSGEGKYLLGSDTQVVTDANGNATLNFPASLATNQFVSATATQAGVGSSSTSEFSQCLKVTPPAGTLQFSLANYSANESQPKVTVVVNRTIGSSGSITVDYATQDVTAKAGQDYTAKSGTLSFADGEVTKTIDIPITDDSLYELNETFKVSLSNVPPDVVLGNISTTTVTIINNDSQPTISIDDYKAFEGDSGTRDFTFNVTLSTPSGVDTSVNFTTLSGSASPNDDYIPVSGTLTFAAGETQKSIVVKVVGDTLIEPDETFSVSLSNATTANIGDGLGTGTIQDDDQVNSTVSFSSSDYQVAEGLTSVSITVNRSGDTSKTTTVGYEISDGSAEQRSDYEYTSGTLTFGPGETSKTFDVLINKDSYGENTENAYLDLVNPVGSEFGENSSATLTITDNGVEGPTNPNDDAQNFVYQQYHDLLNREPDPGGLAYWTGQITQCGADQNCINTKRKDISAAFFIELEFQETGYFVYRAQKASFGQQPVYFDFMADRTHVVAGPQLEQTKRAFLDEWVQRDQFKDAYPDNLSAMQFVNELYDTAGLQGYANERQQAVQDLMSNTRTRAQVLRQVIETPEFKTREYNPAFVLMQYFGYLRRDPDQGGYDFWLNVINNQVPNTTDGYHAMVCAFITSLEYQSRFSNTHTHSNAECGP